MLSIIILECTRVLGVVGQDGLQLEVSHQVSPQQEGETVLECFEARGRLLLSRGCTCVQVSSSTAGPFHKC